MEGPSLAASVRDHPNLVVLRSLSGIYGLAGARCGALITQSARIGRFEEVLEPYAVPTSTVRLAEAALSPSRAVLVENRIALLRSERARLAAAFAQAPAVKAVSAGEGPFLFLEAADPAAARRALERFGVSVTWREDVAPGGLRLDLGAPGLNDRALAAFGVVVASKPSRRAELVRETRETKIAVAVDLDDPAKGRVSTGVGFYDHMLDQVASHGGFRLDLQCRGDLEIDAHHTIEDCALAFGTALKEALGERRGIARFGFVAPMDEAEAKVSVDLGGRPFCVFEGTFEASHIGDYPTEMTAHVFRSLAESLGAAIHVSVTGANDHHKTEICFKAFGRALRQAVHIEGNEIPSTKGVI
jgi:histidinol-phosphate aminotransferase/imidazoleglycerol-phosphate dehydratase/histidinol-phosphatase